MSIDQREDINIKDLVIDEPRLSQKNGFDPKTAFTEREWISIIYSSMTFSTRAGLILLYPDRKTELLSPIKLIQWDLAKRISLLTIQEHSPYFLNASAALKILSPDDFANLEVLKDKETLFGNSTKFLRERVYKQGAAARSVADSDLAANIKLVFPEEFKQGNEDLKLYQELLEGAIATMLKSDLRRSIELETLANYRIMWPEKFKQLNISQEVLEEFYKLFEDTKPEPRPGNWKKAIQIARDLAIITAEDLIITEKEFRLVMPEPEIPLEQPQPIPEKRRF